VTFFGDVSRATGDYNSPETPRPFKLKYWFGGISSPRLSKESVSRGTPVLEMFAGPADEEPCHRANPSDYFMLRFADTETFEAFVPKLDAAITAWKARFGDVPQRAYEGIVAH